MFNHPWYSVIVIVHVLVAVIGFGALGLTGAYARLAHTSKEPFGSEALRRYFRPGYNRAARMIYLVPVTGAIARVVSGETHKLYPYLGIGIWILAMGVATGMMWPNEVKIQRLVSEGRQDGAERGDREALLIAAQRCERAAMITTLLAICAFAVMIAQPS